MNDISTDTITPEQPKRSKIWWIIGASSAILILAASAYLGGKLLAQNENPGGGSGKGGFIMSNGPGGSVQRSVEIVPAEELPKTEPAANGIFVRREDQSFFIGTGSLRMAIKREEGQDKDDVSSDFDGPVVEVVVTNDTVIYQDDSFSGDKMPENDKIQQKVLPGNLDEIGENSMLIVWGRKSGDRVIAEVLVYNNPMFMKAPVP